MTWGSAEHHTREMLPMPDGYRRRCRTDDCGLRATHMGTANGVALISGCEWHVRKWVQDQDAAKLARYQATGEL